MTPRPRAASLLLVALALGLTISGCGQATDATDAQQSGVQAVLIASELVVGKAQRIPLGVLDHNTPVADATVHVRAFVPAPGGKAVFKSQSDAPFHGAGLEGAGAYVAHLDLDTPGNWGLEVEARRPNGDHATTRLSFTVNASPLVPGVGQPAPRSHNPTVKDVPDVRLIDTGNPPDDMHQVSIADAIAQHRPTLVVFASPAFCMSRTCGPEVKAVQALEPAYRDRVTFIHVEIYTDFRPDPSRRRLAPTVLEWRLQTDPWVFLIDRQGIIRARYEGPTATDELKAGLDSLLAS